MIDKLKLSLFLNSDYLINSKSGQSHLNFKLLQMWGFKVSAGSVEYDEVFNDFTGEDEISVVSVTGEQHPWDSLKSSYSGLAIKWQDSNHLMSEPRLEIKASPAKLMQGHNVFGSTSIKDCSKFMIDVLLKEFPILQGAINWHRTTLDLIDVTYSAPVEPRHHKMLISTMRNISSGQMRKSSKSQEYESTCYWGLGSKRKTLKCYLKNLEMQRDLEQLKKMNSKNPFDSVTAQRLKIMSDQKLLDFSKPLMRFEATLKKDFFRTTKFFGYHKRPYYLKDWITYQDKLKLDGECLILNLWKFSFDRLLSSLNGKGVDMQNEAKILEKLKSVYFKETKKGLTFAKAQRVFDFYMRILNEGYDNVYETYKDNRATFGRYKNDLLNATGISLASLQNLRFDNKESNVIPFYKLVEFDFNNQYPEWHGKHVVGGDFTSPLPSSANNVLSLKQQAIINTALSVFSVHESNVFSYDWAK